MIAPESFEMIETISAEALERHPVWASFDAVTDRAVLIGWGVAGEVVDRECARYEYCGHQPLYPVLALDPLPPQSHMIVRMTFRTASGGSLPGYLLAPHAFGVFANGREFCFNRNLPALAGRIAAQLEAALEDVAPPIFPLRYASDLRNDAGDRIAGEIQAFW